MAQAKHIVKHINMYKFYKFEIKNKTDVTLIRRKNGFNDYQQTSIKNIAKCRQVFAKRNDKIVHITHHWLTFYN